MSEFINQSQWIDRDNMVNHPRGWYWASFPGTWVFYAPERNASLCIDHGDLRWHNLESLRYWGPWKAPEDQSKEEADLQKVNPLFQPRVFKVGDSCHIFLNGHNGSTTEGKVVAVLNLPGWGIPNYVVELEIGAPDPVLEVRDGLLGMFHKPIVSESNFYSSDEEDVEDE